MVVISGQGLVDFSFICSLKCNLYCSFCMYDAGPLNNEVLSLDKATRFIFTIDWDRVNSVGFYGGEVAVDIPFYERIVNLLPARIKKFCITNGSWSKVPEVRVPFINFIVERNIMTFISTTPEHKKFQDIDYLDELVECSHLFEYKADDTKKVLLPMGRNYKEDWTCSKKCKRRSGPKRMAMMPNGDIIFQSCDGIYPVIGNYENTLDELLDVKIKCPKMEIV